MLSKQIKHSISFVFLLTFIFIKVAGLHSLSHQGDLDSAKDCVWCHLSGTDTTTPFIASAHDFELDKISIQAHSEIISHYASVDSSKTPVCLIFNKPPPFYTV